MFFFYLPTKIANVIGRMHANVPDLNLCWLSVPEFGSCLVGGDEITCHITGKINQNKKKKRVTLFFLFCSVPHRASD